MCLSTSNILFFLINLLTCSSKRRVRAESAVKSQPTNEPTNQLSGIYHNGVTTTRSNRKPILHELYLC